MKAYRVAAFLAEQFAGATARRNVVEIAWTPPPPRTPPPLTPKMWGLKAAGVDVTWCSKRPETPEGHHLKRESERLRAQLKFERRQTRQGEMQNAK
jgi:hypothetical protein